MAIQLVPRPEEKKPFWVDILFYLSLILVIAAASSYFVLNSLQEKTEKKIQSLNEELVKASASPEAALEKEVLDYQKKIDDFSVLLGSYRYSSQIFPFIESITHPKVSFSSFSAVIDENSIQVSGVADSFRTLGQQLIIFKNEKLIKEVELSGISLAKEDKVSFSFSLILDPIIFTRQATTTENE